MEELDANGERVCTLIGSIDEETVSALMVDLHNLAGNSADPITLVIDSDGGSLEEGFRVIDAIDGLEQSGIRVNAVVQGKAYSMAAFIFAACRGRSCYPHARFMVHKPRYEGFSEDAQYTSEELLQMYREMCYYERETELLLERCGISRQVIDTMMAKDSYFDSDYARDIGLVQSVSAATI